MAKLVDALGSGPSGGNTVEVRFLSWAPITKAPISRGFFVAAIVSANASDPSTASPIPIGQDHKATPADYCTSSGRFRRQPLPPDCAPSATATVSPLSRFVRLFPDPSRSVEARADRGRCRQRHFPTLQAVSRIVLH